MGSLNKNSTGNNLIQENDGVKTDIDAGFDEEE